MTTYMPEPIAAIESSTRPSWSGYIAGRLGAIDRRRRRRHMRHTLGVEAAFLWMILIVVGIGVVVAIALLFTGGSNYDTIGKGAFSMDAPDRRPAPAPGSPAADAEARAEIRQLVEAKSARREARGQAPLDVDAEIEALTRPAAGGADADPALREEIRQLVVARNERRARQGQPPLDVDDEVARQLRELGAG
jgi:hypothetical protein